MPADRNTIGEFENFFSYLREIINEHADLTKEKRSWVKIGCSRCMEFSRELEEGKARERGLLDSNERWHDENDRLNAAIWRLKGRVDKARTIYHEGKDDGKDIDAIAKVFGWVR